MTSSEAIDSVLDDIEAHGATATICARVQRMECLVVDAIDRLTQVLELFAQRLDDR